MDFFVKRKEFLLAVIILWIVFVSFWSFRTNPPYWTDEGIYHQIITNLSDFGIMGLRLSPTTFSDTSLITVGYPVFYPAVVSFGLFGDSVTVLRLTAIGFLLGFLLVTYLLVRNLYGVKYAIISVLLISLFSPLYGNGKTFLGEVPGMFYFVFGLFIFDYALKIKKRRFLVLFVSGVLLGLAASSKPNFLVILPALAVGFVWKWREFLITKERRRGTGIMVLGISAAMLIWFLTQFGINTSAGGVFAHYSDPYHIQNIWPTIFTNLKRFTTESTPLHFLLLLTTTMFMLVIKVFRREQLRFIEIVIMAFVGAIMVFYVRTAGWYRYFFPAHLLLFIFFPVSIEFISQRFLNISAKRAGIISLSVITLLSVVQFWVMYTERFRIGPDEPTVFDQYLNYFDKKESVFFYSVPDIAARYHSSNFYQYIKMSKFLSLGSENIELFKKGFFDRVVMRDKTVDFSFPRCYTREAEINKIIVFKRNYKVSCE